MNRREHTLVAVGLLQDREVAPFSCSVYHASSRLGRPRGCVIAGIEEHRVQRSTSSEFWRVFQTRIENGAKENSARRPLAHVGDAVKRVVVISCRFAIPRRKTYRRLLRRIGFSMCQRHDRCQNLRARARVCRWTWKLASVQPSLPFAMAKRGDP